MGVSTLVMRRMRRMGAVNTVLVAATALVAAVFVLRFGGAELVGNSIADTVTAFSGVTW